jgi:hypothetical protein
VNQREQQIRARLDAHNVKYADPYAMFYLAVVASGHTATVRRMGQP